MKMTIDSELMEELISSAEGTSREEGLMKLYDDKWLMKVISPSNVILFSCMVPESEMESYDNRGVEAIGVRFAGLKKYFGLVDGNVNVEFDLDNHKLMASSGNDAVQLPTTASEYIDGKTDKNPDLKYAAEFTPDVSDDILGDFFTRAKDIAGADSFHICAMENNLYLYAVHDDSRAWEIVPWDDFDQHHLDWSLATESEIIRDPEERKMIQSVFSIDWAKEINNAPGGSKFYINNSYPMKVVFNMDSDAKASYIFSPRVGDVDGSMSTIPEDIIKDEDIKEKASA